VSPPRPVAPPTTPAPTDPTPPVDLAALAGALRFASDRPGATRQPAAATSDEEDEPSMMDHPRQFGWSRAGTHFGWCQPTGGADCETCVLIEVASGERIERERGDDCGRPRAQEIAAVWKQHGIGEQPQPSTWRFGRDLTLTWRDEPGEGDRPARLHVGGRLGEEAPIDVITVVEHELATSDPAHDIFPETIALSPDGARLAIFSHAFAGEFSDKVRLTVIDAAAFAFGVYHGSGLASLKRDPAAAARRFAVAAAIDPGAWKAWHNLACAHALAGRPDLAEGPLARSLAAGGDAARAKARTDPDLADARARPWFAGLVDESAVGPRPGVTIQ
jgi:hypothetical protein